MRTLACKDSGPGGQRRSSEGFDPLSRSPLSCSQRMERSLISLRVGDGLGSFFDPVTIPVDGHSLSARSAGGFLQLLIRSLESCVPLRGSERGAAVRREGTRDGG